MIFLTIGTQLPFDRLVNAVDFAAPLVSETIFGQVGNTKKMPANFKCMRFLPASEFEETFKAARVIIGHAGIGTVLSCIKCQKPLVAMARQKFYGEHRNDHQLATVEQIRNIPGIYIVEDVDDVVNALCRVDLDYPIIQNTSSKKLLISNLKKEIAKSMTF
ncbi:glycosyltransferase [Desulfosediminicola sp.]|uniref:glycosyltransferase n=1 Tax=Desulfosediminicola sp. TaxID=2886825 RepID=UPI003AF2059A